jgi:N-methylhydantoinase B
VRVAGALPPLTDPIELEVWRHLFAAVTEEMGAVLTRSAFSPNIKERRDLSCALFGPDREMVAHAAHIPVHLGSTPLSVAAILDALDLGPGDVALVNDPYAGGTHLPDVTVVAPVHLPPASDEAEGRLLGYVVNRAHHADVGGTAAGSMPLSRHIDDEGVRLPPLRVVRAGAILHDVLQDRFYRHVRTPEEREGDLSAQLAACRAGAERLGELAGTYGADTVLSAMAGLVDHAERMMRAVLAAIPDGRYAAEDVLDDDGLGSDPIPVKVALTVEGDRITVDFEGCAPQVAGPLNAVRAIAVSATLYALRCVSPGDVPASTGLLRPVTIRTPEGTIVSAHHPAPVAGGNVETSQRLVDVLLAALGSALPGRIPAASQGTMNNVALGGRTPEPWAYYETLGGGTGAGDGYAGTSAIHSHMTNTLNTPVEALEHAYPLRIEAYRIRRGSGGAGRWPGGDGLERVYRFLEPTEATLLCERRAHPPPGGAPGLSGEDLLERGGTTTRLPGKVTFTAAPGDVLRVRTPGGGGYGPAKPAGPA